MYNFIFVLFFKLSERRKYPDPCYYGIIMVFLTISSHIFLLLSGNIYFTGYNLLVMAFGQNHSKYLWLPFIILIAYLVYIYYKKNENLIINRYKGKTIITPGNIIIGTGIILIPWLGAIKFLNMK